MPVGLIGGRTGILNTIKAVRVTYGRLRSAVTY